MAGRNDGRSNFLLEMWLGFNIRSMLNDVNGSIWGESDSAGAAAAAPAPAAAAAKHEHLPAKTDWTRHKRLLVFTVAVIIITRFML